MPHNSGNTKYDACAVVAEWLDNQATDIGWLQVKRSYDRQIGKLVAGYEVHSFLISISAWTRGNCLDVDLLDTRTGAITMHCSGPCNQHGELVARLHSLRERIKTAT